MSDEKIIVSVDEDLEELIPRFLENRKKDVQLLREALEANDIAKVQSIGHSLKGVGGGYGFNDLSEIGAKLEIAAREKNVAGIEILINDMSDYMERVDVVYE